MNRFNGTAPAMPIYRMEDTEIHTWFERDRACVELRSKLDDSTIIEWRDDEVREALEDGFLDSRNYHQSAFETAIDLKIIEKG